MTAYILFQCRGRPDAAEFEKYKLAVRPTLKPYDVKVLALHPALDQVEGDETTHDLALLEFPDLATAQAWYRSPEYQAVIGLRTETGNYNAFIFEGLPSPPRAG